MFKRFAHTLLKGYQPTQSHPIEKECNLPNWRLCKRVEFEQTCFWPFVHAIYPVNLTGCVVQKNWQPAVGGKLQTGDTIVLFCVVWLLLQCHGFEQATLELFSILSGLLPD